MNSLLELLIPASTTIKSTGVLRNIEETLSASQAESLATQLDPLVPPNLVAPADTTLPPSILFGLLLASIQQFLQTIGTTTLKDYGCPIPPELILE
jgi:hypothetical protein